MKPTAAILGCDESAFKAAAASARALGETVTEEHVKRVIKLRALMKERDKKTMIHLWYRW
jgi:hypothetical protein